MPFWIRMYWLLLFAMNRLRKKEKNTQSKGNPFFVLLLYSLGFFASLYWKSRLLALMGMHATTHRKNKLVQSSKLYANLD